jgi:hypothetical protein
MPSVRGSLYLVQTSSNSKRHLINFIWGCCAIHIVLKLVSAVHSFRVRASKPLQTSTDLKDQMDAAFHFSNFVVQIAPFILVKGFNSIIPIKYQSTDE